MTHRPGRIAAGRGGNGWGDRGLPVVVDGGVCGARRAGARAGRGRAGRCGAPSARRRHAPVDQKAKTALSFMLPAISQALPYVVLNRTGLPCQTPWAVTTTGSH